MSDVRHPCHAQDSRVSRCVRISKKACGNCRICGYHRCDLRHPGVGTVSKEHPMDLSKQRRVPKAGALGTFLAVVLAAAALALAGCVNRGMEGVPPPQGQVPTTAVNEALETISI